MTTPITTAPILRVTIDQTDMPQGAYADLLDLSVVDDLEAPSMFTLRLLAWDELSAKLTWVDDDRFSIGKPVDIGIGDGGAITTLISGEITSLELEVAAGEIPVLVVRGYDRRHRMTRGTSTRVFTNVKDSEIAAQIAAARQLEAQVTDSGVVHEYVAQRAQTDLAFLKQRARGINYVVVVRGTTLYFGPPPEDDAPKITLSMSKDVIDFSPRMSARDQPGQIEVRSWDPKTKQAIVSTASSQSLDAMGTTSGPALADKAFGKAIVSLVDQPVSTQEEADRLALSSLEERASAFIEGQGTCFGRTDLRAGIVVEMEGLGQRFSGPYDVLSTTHTCSSKGGYRTKFSTSRNAT